MDDLEKIYRKLNPFERNSIGERDIWGDAESDFQDVESIHQSAFRHLMDDIEKVGRDHITRGRFVVGTVGIGKSHLFARLRRKLRKGQFTFAANPPANPWAIRRFVLKKVIQGMKRPVFTDRGPSPYSQLQHVVYMLLKHTRRFALPVTAFHEAWKCVPRRDYYPREEEWFTRHLEYYRDTDIPLHVRRVLFRVLDEETRDLATDWLSGSVSLRNEDHDRLGVGGPLEDHEVADLLKWFGALSIDAGPMVLVLDQLDNLKKDEQIGEIESLLIDLKDSACNWYVIISLVEEKFRLWERILSDPFKGRFGNTDGGVTKLRVSDLETLTPEDAEKLLKARLSSSALSEQRRKDGKLDPFFPLTRERVEELARSDLSNARALLHWASAAYSEAISGMKPLPARLGDFLANMFTDVRERLENDDLSVDTDVIADRIAELFDILCRAAGDSSLKMEKGPLHDRMTSFRGSDRIYRCDAGTVRVIGHDVQKTGSFPSVLKKILDAGPATILVRDGRVGVSGKVTTELLDRFREDKTFIHLSMEDIRTLHAMGALLAMMREGDFEHEGTEPEPTEENILKCLGSLDALRDTVPAREFLRLINPAKEEDLDRKEVIDARGVEGPPGGEPEKSRGGKRVPEAKLDDRVPVPQRPSAGDAQSDASLVTLVEQVMERERWLAFNRLCHRLSRKGVEAGVERVLRSLQADPLKTNVTIFPQDSNPLDTPSIVLWTAEG